MSSTDNNKSITKKKKFTARQTQQVNADRKKFEVLGSPESPGPPNAASATESQLSSSPPLTTLPPNFNQSLPKRKKFKAVSDLNVIMAIRSLPTTTKEMLPTIQKQLLNNFATTVLFSPGHLDLLQQVIPPIHRLLQTIIIYSIQTAVFIDDA